MPEQTPATWDVFISHASEDKATFVEPLAQILVSFGVKTWFDKFSLKIGDSLSRSIDQGLAQSKYGLVVLSPSFISKKWPEYELRGLVAREFGAEKVILPIWYGISRDEVLKFSPPLADKLAVTANQDDLLATAVEIIETIRPDIFTRIMRRAAIFESLRRTEYVELKKLRPSGIKHPELSKELISRIRLIRASLLGVHTHSMKCWLDGFQRDSHPSREIAVWERIAAVYQEYVSMTRGLSNEQLTQVFQLSLMLSLTDDVAQLKQMAKGLPKNAFANICRLHLSQLPAFDIAEDLPDDEEASASARPYDGDLEAFPDNLPEHLIQQLVKARSAKKRR